MKSIIKRSAYGVLVGAISLGITGVASAHVVVRPNEVVTAGFQTFTVGVPNEKSVANTSVKLQMPAGLKHVSPSVKQGWTITVDKSGEGEEATVNAITWAGGSIGAGFRDDFTFSAQVPSTAGGLEWKAYQTYADGVTVAWDKSEADQPKKADGSPDFSTSGPFSITKVVTETAATSDLKAAQQAAADAKKAGQRSMYTAIAALAIAIVGFALATRVRK